MCLRNPQSQHLFRWGMYLYQLLQPYIGVHSVYGDTGLDLLAAKKASPSRLFFSLTCLNFASCLLRIVSENCATLPFAPLV